MNTEWIAIASASISAVTVIISILSKYPHAIRSAKKQKTTIRINGKRIELRGYSEKDIIATLKNLNPTDNEKQEE